MQVKTLLTRLRENHLARQLAILVSGTAFGHILTAAALPIMTHLYSPDQFSIVAVFNSILSIMAVAAALRYDIAIPLPDTDEDGANLMVLAICVAAAISLGIAVIVLFASSQIVAVIGRPQLAQFLWLLAPATFLAASASAFQGWYIRKKGFRLIALSRVGQSAAAITMQLAAYPLKSALGLVLGAIVNVGGGALIMAPAWHIALRTAPWRITPSRMAQLARDYHRFPLYSTWEGLFNVASAQLPLLLIATLYSGSEPGFLMLAMSVIQAPMALFGVSVGQLYLAEAPSALRAGKLIELTQRIINMLVKTGVGPLIAGGILAPFAFPLIFGVAWARSGEILAWMTPWFIMQFIASPISMALSITGHQPRAMLLQVFSLATRIGSVIVAYWLGLRGASEAFAVSGLVSYLVYYVVVMRAIGAPVSSAGQALRRNLPLIAAWAGAAGVAAFAITVAFGISSS